MAILIADLPAIHTRPPEVNKLLKNWIDAAIDKQLLIDIFRVVKGKNEIFLGLIVKTEDFISLYTAEPQRFIQQTQSKTPSKLLE